MIPQNIILQEYREEFILLRLLCIIIIDSNVFCYCFYLLQVDTERELTEIAHVAHVAHVGTVHEHPRDVLKV